MGRILSQLIILNQPTGHFFKKQITKNYEIVKVCWKKKGCPNAIFFSLVLDLRLNSLIVIIKFALSIQ